MKVALFIEHSSSFSYISYLFCCEACKYKSRHKHTYTYHVVKRRLKQPYKQHIFNSYFHMYKCIYVACVRACVRACVCVYSHTCNKRQIKRLSMFLTTLSLYLYYISVSHQSNIVANKILRYVTTIRHKSLEDRCMFPKNIWHSLEWK